ncbi:MAG: prolipoprotein diacylglyceryl transferase [Christensenellaceae bacterium]|nr:prolipoprotein diacylglyceryl transferase [Christensenellaceae bacterium]
MLLEEAIHWTGRVKSVAFTLGKVTVAWYGIIVTLGILAATATCVIHGKKKGLILDDWAELFLFVVPFSILIGRLGYVFAQWEYVFDDGFSFLEMIAVWEGGITITTALLGGVVGASVWALIRKKNILVVIDTLAICVFVGQAIGRWGNFMNQELYGQAITNTSQQWFPYAVFITRTMRDGTVIPLGWFQATFFYEAFADALGFVIGLILLKRIKFKGSGTLMYFGFYCTIRFVMEFYRQTEEIYENGNFTQVIVLIIAILSAITFAVLWIINVKKGNRVWYGKGVPDNEILQADGTVGYDPEKIKARIAAANVKKPKKPKNDSTSDKKDEYKD